MGIFKKGSLRLETETPVNAEARSKSSDPITHICTNEYDIPADIRLERARLGKKWIADAKNSGVITGAQLLAAPNSCDACWEMQFRIFTLEEAERLHITGDCRCCWIGVVARQAPMDREESENRRREYRLKQEAKRQEYRLRDEHFDQVERINSAYKVRKESNQALNHCQTLCEIHIQWMDRNWDSLKDFDIHRHNAGTYKSLAIIYEQDGQLGKAIALCEKAVRLGLIEGSSLGFESRLERLKTKRVKQEK